MNSVKYSLYFGYALTVGDALNELFLKIFNTILMRNIKFYKKYYLFFYNNFLKIIYKPMSSRIWLTF